GRVATSPSTWACGVTAGAATGVTAEDPPPSPAPPEYGPPTCAPPVSQNSAAMEPTTSKGKAAIRKSLATNPDGPLVLLRNRFILYPQAVRCTAHDRRRKTEGQRPFVPAADSL